MRKHWLCVFGCSLLLTLGAAGCAISGHSVDDDDDDDKEHAVTIDQLPAAAKATLMKEAGTGKIEEIDKQQRSGKTVYEADVSLNGQKWEIAVREDGQLLKKQLDEEKDDEDEKDDDDKED